MSSGFGVNPEALEYRAGTWRDLSTLMSDTQSELDSAPAGVFPPSVTGAARAFLATWSAAAGESSDMASAYAASLTATSTSYLASDQAVDDAFGGLDAHLGPSR